MKRSLVCFLCLIALLGSFPGGHAWAGSGASTASQDGFWQPLDGPTGGSVTSLALSPNYADDQTLLATVGRGEPLAGRRFDLLRSVDGGLNWQAHSTGLPDAEMGYLAFSPRFAFDATAYLAVGRRLYRSLDRGLSWTDVGPTPGAPQLYELAVNREGDVYAAAGAGLGGAGNGVWRYATPAYDVVIDGGLEVDSGWELPVTAQPAGYSRRVVYDGARSMRVGVDEPGEATASYSSARQVVALPADALTATLQCHIYPVSGEAAPAARAQVLSQDSAAAGDAQYLLLLDPESGATVDVLLWQLSNAQRWQSYTFDLSAYAGRSLRLHFGVYNDAAGGRTGMYVDNVSLLVWRPAPPGLEPQLYLPLVMRN